MDATTIGMIGFGMLIILLLLRVPVGAAAALAGFTGYFLLADFSAALHLLQTMPFRSFTREVMSVWPLLFLMSGMCLASGMAHDLVHAFNSLLEHRKGGAVISILCSSTLLGVLTGASFGSIVPLQKSLGIETQRYEDKSPLLPGALAASGSLGMLLPPSMIFILLMWYTGIAFRYSLSFLFLAGLLPTLILAVLYNLSVLFFVSHYPGKAPVPVKPASRGQKMLAFSCCWDVFVIIVLILATVYSGLMPIGPAVALATLATFIFAMVRKLSFKSYAIACANALIATGRFFILLFGVMVFSYFFIATGSSFQFSEYVIGLDVNPYIILILVLVLILLLGSVWDSLITVMLIMPILYGLVFRLGFDPVWFGILALRCIASGLLIPPRGRYLRIVRFETGFNMLAVAWGSLPFLCADFILILLLLIFPGLTLWLPHALV